MNIKNSKVEYLNEVGKELVEGNLPNAVKLLLDILHIYHYNSDEFEEGITISYALKKVEKAFLTGTIDFSQNQLEESRIIGRTQILIKKIRTSTFDIKQNENLQENIPVENIVKNNNYHSPDMLYDERFKNNNPNINKYDNKEHKDTIFEGEKISRKIAKKGFELSNVSIHVNDREIVALVGENGCGKTTLLKIIAGHLKADSGVLKFHFLPGDNIDWYLAKQNIAFLQQEFDNASGTVLQNLYYTLSCRGYNANDIENFVNYYLHRLDLYEHQDKTWSELSTGYRLRLALTRELIWRPKLLLLDEPLANLDVKSQSIILNDLKKIVNTSPEGAGIILTSQHLFELDKFADKIMLLKNGRSIFYGDKEILKTEKPVCVFEVIVENDTGNLKNIFNDLNIFFNSTNENSYTLFFKKEVSENYVFELITKNNCRVNYLRNISQSIRKLIS